MVKPKNTEKAVHQYQRGRCPCCNSSIAQIRAAGVELEHRQRLSRMIDDGLAFAPPLDWVPG